MSFQQNKRFPPKERQKKRQQSVTIATNASRSSRTRKQSSRRAANSASIDAVIPLLPPTVEVAIPLPPVVLVMNCGFPGCDCDGTGWSDVCRVCSGEEAALNYAMLKDRDQEFCEALFAGKGASFYAALLAEAETTDKPTICKDTGYVGCIVCSSIVYGEDAFTVTEADVAAAKASKMSEKPYYVCDCCRKESSCELCNPGLGWK